MMFVFICFSYIIENKIVHKKRAELEITIMGNTQRMVLGLDIISKS